MYIINLHDNIQVWIQDSTLYHLTTDPHLPNQAKKTKFTYMYSWYVLYGVEHNSNKRAVLTGIFDILILCVEL